MSFRLKRISKLVILGIFNVFIVLTFYNLGLFLGQMLQKL